MARLPAAASGEATIFRALRAGRLKQRQAAQYPQNCNRMHKRAARRIPTFPRGSNPSQKWVQMARAVPHFCRDYFCACRVQAAGIALRRVCSTCNGAGLSFAGRSPASARPHQRLIIHARNALAPHCSLRGVIIDCPAIKPGLFLDHLCGGLSSIGGKPANFLLRLRSLRVTKAAHTLKLTHPINNTSRMADPPHRFPAD